MPRQTPAWHLHVPAEITYHRSRPRTRAGEDRTIAWTELVHPPALSRPTRSCLCPLFTPSLPMGRVPRSTRLTQRPFRLSTRCCAVRAKADVIPFQQAKPSRSPPRIALSKRSGWGKKFRPVRNVSLWPPTLPYADPVFSAPILGSCHVLGGRGPVSWLPARDPLALP